MALEVLPHFEMGKVTGVEFLDIHFVVAPTLVAKLLTENNKKINAGLFPCKLQEHKVCQISF